MRFQAANEIAKHLYATLGGIYAKRRAEYTLTSEHNIRWLPNIIYAKLRGMGPTDVRGPT